MGASARRRDPVRHLDSRPQRALLRRRPHLLADAAYRARELAVLRRPGAHPVRRGHPATRPPPHLHPLARVANRRAAGARTRVAGQCPEAVVVGAVAVQGLDFEPSPAVAPRPVTSVVSHKYAYESAGLFRRRLRCSSSRGARHTGGFETRPYKSSRLADNQNALASS